MRRCTLGLLMLIVMSGGACGRDIDLAASLQVDAVTTGWFDTGITAGKKKLVPAVSFTLKNASDQKLRVLQVSASFRREGDPDEWGTAYLTAAGSAGLAPGAATGALTLRSQLGYTGIDSGPEMLGNSFFVDARVNLFVKYGSGPWTPVGDYPISRRLLLR
ncbi:MAG: hypothetical protein ABI868_22300 [Acidobacteriota bacterium]